MRTLIAAERPRTYAIQRQKQRHGWNLMFALSNLSMGYFTHIARLEPQRKTVNMPMIA